MTLTIGAVLIKLLITAVVAFIAGLFVGAAWFKRKAANGFTTVDAAAKAELKAREKAIREKALAVMNAELAKARKEFKGVI